MARRCMKMRDWRPALRFGRLDADDLDFEAAEVGVVVFADAVGEIDEAALLEAELDGAPGKAPADGADGSDGSGAGRQAASGLI